MDMSPQRSGGRLAVLLGITVLVGTACGATHGSSSPTSEQRPTPLPVAVTVSADVAGVVAAQDQLGLDLLTTAGSPTGNVVMSPASVALALQMVASGAQGTTATEMAHVLHLPGATAAAPAARQLLDSLHDVTGDQRNTLRVANTVWAQQGMPLLPAYTSTLHSGFDSTVRTTDFAQHPDQATNEIDKTISEQTAGLIPQLFPAGALDESTRLVLANAVYLAASWARAFDPKFTRPGTFTRPDGTTVPAQMMSMDPNATPDIDTPSYGYASGTGYQAVTLPYVGGKLAFTVLLPTGTSLTPLLATLRTTGLPSILAAVRPTQLEITMPKFTVQSDLDLKPALTTLGMPTAFTDRADFGGITTATSLNISTVRHDAIIKVDEHGTTAAAATGVGMQATAMPERVVVAVNHPFLFVITDTTTGAPLFLGQVTDPTK